LDCEEVSGDLVNILSAISRAIVDIGVAQRRGSNGFGAGIVGTQNVFGDEQLEVDVTSDKAVFERLKASGICAVASSEETTEEVDLGGSQYGVAFDPLDGSSIVDANFTVGSIFGVWEGKTLLNRTGREQKAAVVAMYGPRITMALAIESRPGCMELTYMENGGWKLTKDFKIAPEGKVFAPGNLRATVDNPKYNDLVQHWISNAYTLRYTGGLVPDVYHILFKGNGMFTNVSSPNAKAKLRLLYECAPIAFIVEACGGKSVIDPAFADANKTPKSVLDVVIDDLDKRIGLCCGSAKEVDRFQEMMFN
jgi:sedoheptulose-bisphosphatase